MIRGLEFCMGQPARARINPYGFRDVCFGRPLGPNRRGFAGSCAARRARPIRGSGMPETIRATGGSLRAPLRHHRFRAPAVAGVLSLPASAAVAQGPLARNASDWPWPFNSPHVAAIARLEQHEVAALALIQSAATLPSAKHLRGRTYATLFGLLAVTGLRINEALHLDRSDVDLETGVLVDANPAELRIGQPLVSTTTTLETDGGQSLLTFAFRPTGAS